MMINSKCWCPDIDTHNVILLDLFIIVLRRITLCIIIILLCLLYYIVLFQN